MWTLETVTAPTAEPVTTAEAKAHLRVTTTDEDSLIGRLIQAAREYVEAESGLALMSRTLRLVRESWPSGSRLYLPRPPLGAVSSIQYVDSGGTTQTWNSSDYTVCDLWPAYVRPDTSWPDIYSEPGRNILVTYTAGYATADSVPAALKQAILLHVGYLFENRESVITGTISEELTFAMRGLIMPYRVFWDYDR